MPEPSIPILMGDARLLKLPRVPCIKPAPTPAKARGWKEGSGPLCSHSLKKRQGKSERDLVGAVSALAKKPSKVARPLSPWRQTGEHAEAVCFS